MSAHYLVDLYSQPLSTAPIVDFTTHADFPINGSFAVRIPDDASVQEPVNYLDLITKKYAGLLAAYPGFTWIAYDDFTDTTNIDFSYTEVQGNFGTRGTVKLAPGGVLRSLPITLSGSTGPAQVVLGWELFTHLDANPKDGRLIRRYHELPSSPVNATCQVSFDAGSTWNTAYFDTPITIPFVGRGQTFLIRITNTSGAPLGIGSWWLVY